MGFSRGGRPVIYQSEQEYFLLHDSANWRHVTYDPNVTGFVDFTWEREWRLKASHIDLDPSFATLLVPTSECENRLISRFYDMECERTDFANAMLGGWYYSPKNLPFHIEVIDKN